MSFLARSALARVRVAPAAVAAPVLCRGMATGTVKWFNIKKGFGFITPDDASQAESASRQAAGAPATREGGRVVWGAWALH